MKLGLALHILARESSKKLIREGWDFQLFFNRDGYLTLRNSDGEITPYTISEYDFNYEWEIIE